MADLGRDFNPSAVPEREGGTFDLIPKNTRAMMQVIESEIKTTGSGGTMVSLTWEIIDGPYSNRRIWSNYNIKNANPKAQEIGQRDFADICEATGAGTVRNTYNLHFKPLIGIVGIEKNQDPQYPDKNKVYRVMPLDQKSSSSRPETTRTTGNAGGPGASHGAPNNPPQGGADGKRRPWGNRAQQPVNTAASINDDIPF